MSWYFYSFIQKLTGVYVGDGVKRTKEQAECVAGTRHSKVFSMAQFSVTGNFSLVAAGHIQSRSGRWVQEAMTHWGWMAKCIITHTGNAATTNWGGRLSSQILKQSTGISRNSWDSMTMTFPPPTFQSLLHSAFTSRNVFVAHWGPGVHHPALWPPPSQVASAYYSPIKWTQRNTICYQG